MDARDRRVADARLAVFVVLVVLGLLLARGTGFPIWWLAIPAHCLPFLSSCMSRFGTGDRSRRSV